MVGSAREAELQDVPAPAVGVALQELHPAPGTRGRPLRRETRRDRDGLDLVAEGAVMQFALRPTLAAILGTHRKPTLPCS